MRETRSYGSEGGESGTTGLPYPYQHAAPIRGFRIFVDEKASVLYFMLTD
jgi:hypothetical protein